MGLNLQHTNAGEAWENPAPHQLLSVEAPNSRDNQGKPFPKLPDAEIESTVITQMFARGSVTPQRLAGNAATQEQVTADLRCREYQYFHFTGHGTYNFSNPLLSALALEQEDRLRVKDICQLDLSHFQIVSLSACETAITGNQTISSEYLGLVTGFLRQGVSHIVGTLWRVESVSSALFMIEFYRRFFQGTEPAVALKQTQEWLRNLTYSNLAQWYVTVAQEVADDIICSQVLQDKAKIIQNDHDKINSPVPPYAHPYYWASFTITGNLNP